MSRSETKKKADRKRCWYLILAVFGLPVILLIRLNFSLVNNVDFNYFSNGILPHPDDPMWTLEKTEDLSISETSVRNNSSTSTTTKLITPAQTNPIVVIPSINESSTASRSEGRKMKKNHFNSEAKIGGLPTPIFVVSLPKSATTSAHSFFGCGRYSSSNHFTRDGELVGKCFKRNVLADRPPFEGCGEKFKVWTDTAYQKESGECYFPAIDGLDAFYKSYPNATILLMTRNTDSWYKSVVRYKGGQIRLKMILCNATGFPSLNATSTDWKNMYEWHTERVRTFANLHPSITYLEFSIEDPLIAQKLELSTGIKSKCWQVSNSNNIWDFKEAATIWSRGEKDRKFSKIKPGLNRELKRIRNLDQVTSPTISKQDKRLPTPILVSGLPDNYVSSKVHEYFTCGGYKSANFWTNTSNGQIPIGECYQNNVLHGRPPLEGCGDVEVWTETGYSNLDGRCYHPSVDGLDEFRKAYPNGTLILMKGDPSAWSRRLEDDDLERLEVCNTTNFPGRNWTIDEWETLYKFHDQLVRLYGYQYPSLTFLEFLLKGKVAEQLEEVTGISASCWRK